MMNTKVPNTRQLLLLLSLLLSRFNLSDLGLLGVAPTNWSRYFPLRKRQFVITRG